MPAAAQILRDHGRAVERYLHQALARASGVPSRLIEAIEYSLFAGGKRLRPTLVLECERAVVLSNAPSPQTTANPQPSASALAAAGAIELIHTFSLVHDDLPAMDDDDLRRGRPTSHKVFGDAMAILAGDAMTTLAFELLAADADSALAPRLIHELCRAAGPAGMIGGQVMDIEAERRQLSLDQLQRIHRMKTGALIRCACRMGAMCATAKSERSHVDALTSFAEHLGLAFQIIDDVLDEVSTPEQMGKATHKDASHGKNTYPMLLGIEGAKREAANQLQLALAALNDLGTPADGLRELARFVIRRET